MWPEPGRSCSASPPSRGCPGPSGRRLPLQFAAGQQVAGKEVGSGRWGAGAGARDRGRTAGDRARIPGQGCRVPGGWAGGEAGERPLAGNAFGAHPQCARPASPASPASPRAVPAPPGTSGAAHAPGRAPGPAPRAAARREQAGGAETRGGKGHPGPLGEPPGRGEGYRGSRRSRKWNQEGAGAHRGAFPRWVSGARVAWDAGGWRP